MFRNGRNNQRSQVIGPNHARNVRARQRRRAARSRAMANGPRPQSINRRSRNPNIPNTFRPRSSGTRFAGSRRNLIRTGSNRPDTQILSKREKWFDVIKGVHKYEFLPGRSGIPHLDRFANIHEQAQLRYMEIIFTPSSGTTIPGNLTMGVDYVPGNDRKDPDISTLSPNVSGPIFTSSRMRVIINRSNKGRTWFSTAAGANDPLQTLFALYINAATTADFIGEIWVEYKIAFATATSSKTGDSVAVPIAVATMEHVSDVNVSQPAITEVQFKDTPELGVLSPPTSQEVTKEGTSYETELSLDVSELPTGSLFTLGTLVQSPASIAELRHSLRMGPKIAFKYADGTAIPSGSIRPVDSTAKLSVTGNSKLTFDPFATVFQIVKQLGKPIVSTVTEFLNSLLDSEGNYMVSGEPEGFLNVPAENYTVFSFLGDEATITVPTVSTSTLAERLPVTIMLAGARGLAESSSAGYIETYDYEFLSPDNQWLASHTKSGDGVNSTLTITFTDPRSEKTFNNADLVYFYYKGITLEKGIGTSVKTPYPAPLSDDTWNEIVQSIANNSKAISGTTSVPLLIVDSVNQSEADTPGDFTGAYATFRIEPNAVESYESIDLVIPTGHILSGIPNGSTDQNSDSTNFHRPSGTEYVYGTVIMNISLFPTVSPPHEAPPEEYIQITRVNRVIRQSSL